MPFHILSTTNYFSCCRATQNIFDSGPYLAKHMESKSKEIPDTVVAVFRCGLRSTPTNKNTGTRTPIIWAKIIVMGVLLKSSYLVRLQDSTRVKPNKQRFQPWLHFVVRTVFATIDRISPLPPAAATPAAPYGKRSALTGGRLAQTKLGPCGFWPAPLAALNGCGSKMGIHFGTLVTKTCGALML